MQPWKIIAFLLLTGGSAAAPLLVGSEPELEEVVVEFRTPNDVGLAAVVTETAAPRAGLAAVVTETAAPRAGLAAVIVELTVPPLIQVCGNGIVEPGEQCDDGADGDDTNYCFDDCTRNPEIIPTVSQWGLVVMVLFLLTGAKVYYGRQRSASSH